MQHYAFLTFDSPGHIAGIINLADKIIKIHPEILATVYVACSIEGKWGTTKVSNEPIPGLKLVKLRVEPDGDYASAPFDYALAHPNQVGSDVVEALKKEIASRPGVPLPSLTISDHFGSTWAYQVARSLGIKSYIYMPTPILFWSVLRILPEALSRFDRKANLEIPHYGPLQYLQLPPPWDILNFITEQCHLSRLHDGMLINDQEETYSQEYISTIREYLGGNAWFIGYMPPNVKQIQANLIGENDAIFQWLNLQKPRSVIYISVGTEATLCAADRVELALALEKLGCPAIWSLKKLEKDIPYRPIHAADDYKERECSVPCDEYGLPEGWLERMGDGVKILEWAPQIGILNHPSTGLFISHCGWNSMLECMSVAGIPIAGIPMLSDQPMNADMMEKRLKIGKNLWENPAEGELECNATANIIREIMNNKEFIENAANLKTSNAERFNTLSGTSMKRLNDFINKNR